MDGDRDTEVTPHRFAKPTQILLMQWQIKAKLLNQFCPQGGVIHGPQHDANWIARSDVNQEKYDDAGAKKRGHGQQQALKKIYPHLNPLVNKIRSNYPEVASF